MSSPHCPPDNDSVQLRKLLQNDRLSSDAFIKIICFSHYSLSHVLPGHINKIIYEERTEYKMFYIMLQPDLEPISCLFFGLFLFCPL